MHQNSRIESHHHFHKNITKSAQINKTRTHTYIFEASFNYVPQASIKCRNFDHNNFKETLKKLLSRFEPKLTYGINKEPKDFPYVVIKIYHAKYTKIHKKAQENY
jgi:hypothetical protein